MSRRALGLLLGGFIALTVVQLIVAVVHLAVVGGLASLDAVLLLRQLQPILHACQWGLAAASLPVALGAWSLGRGRLARASAIAAVLAALLQIAVVVLWPRLLTSPWALDAVNGLGVAWQAVAGLAWLGLALVLRRGLRGYALMPVVMILVLNILFSFMHLRSIGDDMAAGTTRLVVRLAVAVLAPLLLTLLAGRALRKSPG